MSVIIGFIYIGGAFAMPKEKIGFANRLFWPFMIGDWLHTEIYKKGYRHD